MTRSGYEQYVSKPHRQPKYDPRKHLDARMNELLDELYKIPTVTPTTVANARGSRMAIPKSLLYFRHKVLIAGPCARCVRPVQVSLR